MACKDGKINQIFLYLYVVSSIHVDQYEQNSSHRFSPSQNMFSDQIYLDYISIWNGR